MKNRIIKKIMNLIPIMFFLSLIATLSYSIYYSYKLEEQIWERDKTIRELSFSSKLVEDHFDIKYNPADSTTSYVLKNTKRNTITITQGRTTITRDSLIKEYNSLIDEYNELIDEKGGLETVLKIIEKEYNISYEISIDSNTIRTRLRNTDMVDSGLVLLPYYRDRIERKPEGLWRVAH